MIFQWNVMRLGRAGHDLSSICAVTRFESSSANNSHHTFFGYGSDSVCEFGRLHELLRP
jgi:hypothetical protein